MNYKLYTSRDGSLNILDYNLIGVYLQDEHLPSCWSDISVSKHNMVFMDEVPSGTVWKSALTGLWSVKSPLCNYDSLTTTEMWSVIRLGMKQ